MKLMNKLRFIIGQLIQEHMPKPMFYTGTDPFSGYSGMILYQSSKKEEPC